MTASGWNFFALTTCLLNQFLTSSCSTSGSSWWVSSRCLQEVSSETGVRFKAAYRLSCNRVSYRLSAFLLWHFQTVPTISSLQIGQTSLELAAVTEGPPFSNDTLELKSWIVSGNGDVANGEAVESLELRESVLSEGEISSFVR